MKAWAQRGYEWAGDNLAGLWSPVIGGATNTVMLDLNPASSNQGSLVSYSDSNAAYVGSQVGTVLSLNGTNNRVSLSSDSVGAGNPRDLTAIGRLGSPGTWVCWVFRTATGGSAFYYENLWGILNLTATGGVMSIRGIDFSFSGSQLNRWECLAFTYNGATRVRGFVNGNFAGTATGTNATLDPFAFSIGARSQASSFMPGLFAELAIFRSELTDGQISQYASVPPGGIWSYEPPRVRSRFAQVLTFKAYWNRRQSQLIGGGL